MPDSYSPNLERVNLNVVSSQSFPDFTLIPEQTAEVGLVSPVPPVPRTADNEGKSHIWNVLSFGSDKQLVPFVSSNSRLISLIGSKGAYQNSITMKSFLEKIYGSRLTNEIFEAYNIDNQEDWKRVQLDLVRMAMSVRVSEEDLKDLYQRLAQMQQNSEDYQLLAKVVGEKELNHLMNLCKNEKFDKLSDEQVSQLIGFFRKDYFKNDFSEEINFPEETFERFRSLPLEGDQKKTLEQDLEIFQLNHRWSNFHSEQFSHLAISEFIARDVAYKHIRKGVILQIPTPENKTPSFYKVNGGVDNHGFASFIISGIGQRHQNIKFVNRGTVPTDKESIGANLARSSGKDAFKKNKKELLPILKEAIEHVDGKVTLDINGHSMGGALSQHACSTMASVIRKAAEQDDLFPWDKIDSINMIGWNAPAVTEKQALKFANHAEFLAKHPKTTHLTFNLNFPRVEYDIVHTCGEMFLGNNRKSNNINTHIYYFPTPSKTPILGPHTSSIFLASKPDAKPSSQHHEDRSGAYHTQKQIGVMLFLINSNHLIQDFNEMIKNCKSPEQKKVIQELRNYSPEQLELLIQAAKQKQCREMDILKMNPDDFETLVYLLNEFNVMKQEVALIQTFADDKSSWLTYLRNLDPKSLEEACERLKVQYKEEQADLKAKFDDINYELITPSYNRIPTVINYYAVSPLLRWSKSLLEWWIAPEFAHKDHIKIKFNRPQILAQKSIPDLKVDDYVSSFYKERIKALDEELNS